MLSFVLGSRLVGLKKEKKKEKGQNRLFSDQGEVVIKGGRRKEGVEKEMVSRKF